MMMMMIFYLKQVFFTIQQPFLYLQGNVYTWHETWNEIHMF